MWRSLLFVPILNQRLVDGAARRSADAVVLDLEAAVPPTRKDEARRVLPKVIAGLKGAGSDVAVRINPLHDGGEEDITVARRAGADLIVLPHATPDATARTAELAQGCPLIPLIESPRGVIQSLEIAEVASVAGLGLGVEDYATEMGAPAAPELLVPAAFQVIQAARAANRAPLILPDTIADYTDTDRFEAAAQLALKMGAAGGFAIHPAQVEILNRVFRPTAQDRQEAQAILAAADTARANGHAIAKWNGRMVDEPVETRARAILALCARFGET